MFRHRKVVIVCSVGLINHWSSMSTVEIQFYGKTIGREFTSENTETLNNTKHDCCMHNFSTISIFVWAMCNILRDISRFWDLKCFNNSCLRFSSWRVQASFNSLALATPKLATRLGLYYCAESFLSKNLADCGLRRHSFINILAMQKKRTIDCK